MQSLSLSHPHIVRPFQFHSCIRKERIPWQTPRRHALRSQSLRWHYPNQVRSKIYLPLSLSHKLPLALFFSVFQYSTHLSRCQTSTAYCSLHSRRRRYCSLRSQQHASRCTVPKIEKRILQSSLTGRLDCSFFRTHSKIYKISKYTEKLQKIACSDVPVFRHIFCGIKILFAIYP